MTQRNAANANRLKAEETIGAYTLVQTLQEEVEPAKILINPINFSSTRLANMAKNFQEYRVHDLEFTVFSNAPTTVGGLMATGSSSNPEHDIPADKIANISAAIFALQGGTFSSLWTPIKVKVNCSKNWLKVDPDSSQSINTCAGALFMSQISSTNMTGTIVCPVVLRYDIEFRSAQLAAPAPPSFYEFPPCIFAKTNGPNAGTHYISPVSTASPLPVDPGMTFRILGEPVTMNYIDPETTLVSVKIGYFKVISIDANKSVFCNWFPEGDFLNTNYVQNYNWEDDVQVDGLVVAPYYPGIVSGNKTAGNNQLRLN